MVRRSVDVKWKTTNQSCLMLTTPICKWRSFESSDDLMRAADSLPSTSHAVHPTDAGGVPVDLNECRTRIDASVQEQKRNREVIAALSNKVSNYRQKAAETTAQLVDSATVDICRLSNTPPAASSATVYRGDPERVSLNPVVTSDTFASSIVRRENMDSSAEFILEQLKEEQIRSLNLEEINEMLHERAEVAVQANTFLRQDLAAASEQLKRFAEERTLLRRQNHRTAELLNTQNEHIRELWAACNHLRRQMKDFRTETENDLERQKTEFTRCANNMERAIQQVEIKRQQTQPMKDSAEDEAFENLLKDYDKIAVRNMRLEHEQSENTRKLLQLELALKRANDERDLLRDSLKKIHQMPELVEARGRRARSISPSGYPSSFDAMRLIRVALQNRVDEIRMLKRSFDDTSDRLNELKQQLLKSEEARRLSDNATSDLRKKLQSAKREKDEVERENRRFCEKVEKVDAEKAEANAVIIQLREEISALHRSYQTSLDEMLQKQQDESDRRRKEYNDCLEERDKESATRLTKLRNEMERCRAELENAKEQLRRASADCYTERRRADDIERALEESRKVAKDQLFEIDELKRRVETQELEVADLERQIEEFKTGRKEHETILSKLKSEKEALIIERSKLTEEIATVRSELFQKTGFVERLQVGEHEWSKKVQELAVLIEGHERSATEARDALVAVEAKLAAANDHISAMEAERAGDREDLEKCRYDITVLRQEKTQLNFQNSRLKDESVAARSALSEMQRQMNVWEEKVKAHNVQKINDEETIQKLKSSERKLRSALDEAHVELEAKLREREDVHSKEREKFENEFLKLEKQLKDDSKNSIAELNGLLLVARNEKSEVEKRLTKIERELEERSTLYDQLMKEYEGAKERLEDLRESSEKEISRLRREYGLLEQQHAIDATEWDEEKAKMRSEWDEAEKKWREEMSVFKEKHKESTVGEQALREMIDELSQQYEGERETVRNLRMELDEREDMTKIQLESFDRERQQWSLKVRSAEAEGRRARADAEIAKAKCVELEKALAELQQRLSKKMQNLNEMEVELKEMEERWKAKDTAESSVKDRLADIQRELDQLTAQRDRLRTVVDESTKEKKELLESIAISRKELVIVKNKLAEQELDREKRITELERVQVERNEIMTQLSEKNNQLVAISEMVKQLEQARVKAINDLDMERRKNAEADVGMAKTRAENERLSRDVAQMREILDKKSLTSKAALNDIIENYRAAERAKADALRDKEEIAEELAILRDQFAMVDVRRIDAERKLADSEASRQRLQEQVDHFEASARRALSCNQAQTSLRQEKSHNGAAATGLKATVPTSFSSLRGSASSHDITSAQNDEEIEAGAEQLDINTSVEITFRYLRDRIDQLERDKSEHSSLVAGLRAELQQTIEQNREAMKTVDHLRKRIAITEDEKRGAESHLASCRQLLLSQEELVRSKDRELKALKSRFMSIDLHTREKEAKISTLIEQIASLKSELATMEEERRSWKESEALWEEERSRLDVLQKRTEEELQRYRAELSSLSSMKENLAIRLSESERASAVAERRCGELEMAVNDYRDALARLQMSSKAMMHSTRSSSVCTYRRTEVVSFSRQRREISASASIKLYKASANIISDESDWKNKIDCLERRRDGASDMEHKLRTLQREYDESTVKWKGVEMEKNTLKNELEELRNRHVAATQKIVDLQQAVEELTADKGRIQDRVNVIEKLERDHRTLDGEMRRELEQLRADKVRLVAELDDFKRRVVKSEAERRELEANRARLERERVALKRQVETLEEDKQRTDSAVRQTAAERQALDKSLSAMEKENMELYRNCSQLQNQVAQLEKDNDGRALAESAAQRRVLEGHLQRLTHEKREVAQLEKDNDGRALAESAAQRRVLEGHLQRLTHEKRELERVLEQREQAHMQKMKLLESKIAVLREQLETERKRRRDFVERATANERDIGELRSGLDGSIASLQRLTIQTPVKGRRAPDSGIRTRAHSTSRSPFRL
ncbi:Major antigen [Toxocara canis]|uniref:Major antigen n=1 Tax=Toxocara canis TaxID=6265 RepID=A0A0B2VUJ3_TOXCA|nr:Major antigen [Toxocara canis]